jgi:stage V sporulation protein R
MIEFLQSHTSVMQQLPFDHPYYSGINPYALGFAMMSDIKRICQEPTAEDRYWFPDIAGQDWIKVLDFAMRNFKDESFIAQYLSPKVMRDFKLFAVLDDDTQDELEVTAIHDEAGYRRLAAGAGRSVQPRQPRAEHSGVERGPSQGSFADPAPYALQPPPLPLQATSCGDSQEVLKHLHRLMGLHGAAYGSGG